MNNNRWITLNTNKNIVIEFTNERIIPASGLAVVGAVLGKIDFIKKLNRMDVTANRSQHQIKNGDIILTYLGMLCMGKPYFEAIHEMDDAPAFYKASLGITRAIPSEETLRQRIDDIGDSLRQTILEQNVEMLLANKIQPTALPNGLVPVDIDVTPMDNSKSNKEGVSQTYKGFDGYALMMTYIGTEGYAINFELREGKQHCQKGTVESVYISAYSSFLEAILAGNYARDYLEHMASKIREYAFQYKMDYTKYYEQLEDYMKGSVQAVALSEIGKAGTAAGKALAKVPILSKGPVDEALIAAGKKIRDVGSGHGKSTMKEFRNNRDAGIQMFVSNIETVNELSNRPVEVLFNKEEVYICA